jgi:replicative DNA helicase
VNAPIDIDTSWLKAIEAEQSVLGGLMLDNSAYDRVASVVRDGDFYQSDHRLIFQVIVGEISAGRSADILTVVDRLNGLGKLQEAGGQSYLGELSANTPSSANILRYAEIVAERSVVRALYAAAQGITRSVLDSRGRSAHDLIDAAQSAVMSIRESVQKGRGDFHTAEELIREVGEFVDGQHEKYLAGELQDVTGLSTGFAELDKRTTGLHPGELVILAARPAMGKSALALNIAENSARISGKVVLFFSLEMSLRQLGLRAMASKSGINVQRLVTGRVYEQEWPRVANALGGYSGTPLVFCELGGLSVMDVRMMARKARREYGEMSLIIIDYLGLMAVFDDRANPATQIAQITRGLKLLAKELQVPVMVLSQLNRELEKRPNKRPTLADLRDSGAIEQDADIVWFIYRDEVYNPNSSERGQAEVITAKQRNGPTGTDFLKFRGDFTRFDNLENA